MDGSCSLHEVGVWIITVSAPGLAGGCQVVSKLIGTIGITAAWTKQRLAGSSLKQDCSHRPPISSNRIEEEVLLSGKHTIKANSSSNGLRSHVVWCAHDL